MNLMRDDDNDIVEIVEDADIVFDDPVAQRCYAFVHLAKYAEGSTDAITRDLTYTMMRKVCSSIKATSTADLRVIDGGQAK
jgi:hypothetical protein